MPRAEGEPHPPKPEADRSEKVNTKERRYAIRSAIAATTDPTLVSLRGHIFEAELPIVAVNDLESLERTKQVIEFLEAAGLYEDVLRAKYGRHIRAGRGKLRGRKYKHKKSVLIVAGENTPILKAARKPFRSRRRNSGLTECRTARTGHSRRSPYCLDRVCNWKTGGRIPMSFYQLSVCY